VALDQDGAVRENGEVAMMSATAGLRLWQTAGAPRRSRRRYRLREPSKRPMKTGSARA